MSKKNSETKEFHAEVRQLLDIVIHSLYTDREIFIRELISNASDALEKLRMTQLTENKIFEGDLPLEVNITTDETAKTITISDYGIGMTREELSENLGTIAHSGTKAFLERAKDGAKPDVIGQFGVGFYSAYMVADKVEVFTHSWKEDEEHLRWESDGASGYTIDEVEGQRRGSRIVVHLKEEHEEFAKTHRVRGIVERYSNFVGFPVNLNGERVNTVEALWLRPKKEVTDEQYKEFYQFTAHAMDDPRYTMHFSADAPLAINALLFVPEENAERMGLGAQPPGVALYCRKVLIDAQPEGLLPEWLRFVKGVVDSEDLPLNISRESMQDTALVRKLSEVITKRFIKFLAKQAEDSPEDYKKFYERFNRFLKEGIVASPAHQELLAGLLRFESSMTDPGELSSFDGYLDRMNEGQEEIYFLVGSSREALERGPYFEGFRDRGLEVAFFTEAVDDYVLEGLREYKGKKLIAANRSGIELEDLPQEGEEDSLDEKETEGLISWLNSSLEGRVAQVEAGKRLVNHPMVALLPEDAPNAQMRAMMEAMGQEAPEAKAKLEVNPRHPLIRQLASIREERGELASKVADQLTNHALLAAGMEVNTADMAEEMAALIGDLLE
ncbi:MAG: molecular chaperone HtpG [Roseibacillus sp.]|nr:molecular chaperone HtpG [Roseibacillus sp.]